MGGIVWTTENDATIVVGKPNWPVAVPAIRMPEHPFVLPPINRYSTILTLPRLPLSSHNNKLIRLLSSYVRRRIESSCYTFGSESHRIFLHSFYYAMIFTLSLLCFCDVIAFTDLYKKIKKAQPPLSLHGQLLWREFFYCAATKNKNFDKMEGNPICVQIPWDRNPEALAKWANVSTHNQVLYIFIVVHWYCYWAKTQ